MNIRPIDLIPNRSPSGGYLGSCIDDERSKARKVVWRAAPCEPSTLRTQTAPLFRIRMKARPLERCY